MPADKLLLLPPKGEPNGKTYVLCNPSGARDQPWTFRDGGWFFAKRVRQSPTEKGASPREMAKKGWQFQEKLAPGITPEEAKVAARVRNAAAAFNDMVMAAREAGISVSFGVSTLTDRPSVTRLHELRLLRPDDWENDTPGREL